MEKFIKKANVLIEALPYIQNFRNTMFVIKFGGSVIGQESYTESVLQDIVFLECIGINPIIVHGGGHFINSTLKDQGMNPKFIQGLRVTDNGVLNIVIDCLQKVNKHLVDTINSLKGKAVGVLGYDNIIKAKKHFLESEDSQKTDIGYVGDISNINPKNILNLIQKGIVPVIAPLGYNDNNDVFNINADTAAGEIASALKCEKLIYLTDIEGIMKNPEDPNSLISTLHISDIENFINNDIISGGMIPKVLSCLKALHHHAHKTHIIDGRTPHSLLLEIFTNQGIGTQIIN